MPTISNPTMIRFSSSEDGEGGEQFTFVNEFTTTDAPSSAVYAAVLAKLDATGYAVGADCSLSAPAKCRKRDIELSRDIKRHGGGGATPPMTWVYLATCQFSRKDSKGGGPSPQKDPTLKLPDITVSQNKSTVPAIVDQNEDPVVNSAGDPVDRGKPDAKLIITIDKAVATIAGWKLQKAPIGFMFSRNLATWNPWGATFSGLFEDWTVGGGKGTVEDLRAKPVFENGQKYVQLHGEFHVDDDRFLDRFWDMGFRGWPDEDDEELGRKISQLLDPRTSMFPSQPIPLNGLGCPLGVGGTGPAPFELSYQYRKQMDWSGLPLP